MSNYLAIATVTAALRQMLYDSINRDVAGADVTILPPDDPLLKSDAKRLNVYLYQVTQNAAWRGADLPSLRRDGSLATRPQLGLNLHYLFTAYGKATETDPEIHRILGSALRTIHEQPILSRDSIRAAADQPFLTESDLADQVEGVKLTPEFLSLDELSKLWSVFFQTPYRVSFACSASVVLIEGKRTPKPSLPVRERGIYVLPFARPEIAAVEPQTLESAPASTLVIRGRNLSGAGARVFVRLGQIETSPELPHGNDRFSVRVPSGLRAGINPVQVIHKVEMGKPPVPHRGFESNVSAFILAPRIVGSAPFKVKRGSPLSIECDPPVWRSQRVALLVGGQEIARPVDPAQADPTTMLSFPIPGDLAPGIYLMRLRVDGAESTLQVDPDPNDPVYTGPMLEVTQ